MTDSNSTEVTDEEIKALEAELAAIDSGGKGIVMVLLLLKRR